MFGAFVNINGRSTSGNTNVANTSLPKRTSINKKTTNLQSSGKAKNVNYD